MKPAYSIVFTVWAPAMLLSGALMALALPKGQPELWLNGHYHRVLDYFFYYLTETGTGYFFAIISALFLFRRFSLALTLGIQGLLATLTSNVLKHVVFTESPRPPAFFTDHSLLHILEDYPLFYANSFPSGHSMTIALLCTTLSTFLPKKYAPALLIWTLLVLASRMYLLRHFMLDVCVGGFIGWGISLLTTTLLLRYFDSLLGEASLINYPKRR